MLYNMESHLLSNDKCIEKSVDKNLHSDSDIETRISHKYIKILKCESIPISLNKHENDDLLATVEKAETGQIEKCRDDQVMSSNNEGTQNNLKEKNNFILIEKTHQVLNEIFKPTEESSEKWSKRKKRAFSLLDTLISLIIVGPLVIGCWMGLWTWMDLYSEFFSGWFCFAFGIVLHTIFAIYRNQFHETYINKWTESCWQKRLPYRALRNLYTYAFGVACIAHWRGGWILIDNFLYMHIWITTSLMCSLLACLVILRSVRNLIATPMIIMIDRPSYVFQFPTRYNMVKYSILDFVTSFVPFDMTVNFMPLTKLARINWWTKNTRDWSLYLLDCAFSIGVVGTLVVFVWRGLWILLDIYLFPKEPQYSVIGSLVIGYIIVAVTFCLQPLMRYVCTRLQGLLRLIVADAFLLLSFVGTVNVWRGVWNALDLWVLPNDRELSCWITHIGCFILLVLLNCSNSILVRGVYIDAEEEEGKCVVFPIHYLRLFFKIEREKKQARQQKLLVTQDFDDHVDVNEKDSENGNLFSNNTAVTIIPANADSLA